MRDLRPGAAHPDVQEYARDSITALENRLRDLQDEIEAHTGPEPMQVDEPPLKGGGGWLGRAGGAATQGILKKAKGKGMEGMLNGSGLFAIIGRNAETVLRKNHGGALHLTQALGGALEDMGGPQWHKMGHWRVAFHKAHGTLHAAHSLCPLHGEALHRALTHLAPTIRHDAQTELDRRLHEFSAGALTRKQRRDTLAARQAWVKEHPQNLHLRPQYVRQGPDGRFRKLPKKLKTLLGTAGLGIHQLRHMVGGALPMHLPQGSQARLEQLTRPPDPESSGVILYNYGGKNMGAGASVHGGRLTGKRRYC